MSNMLAVVAAVTVVMMLGSVMSAPQPEQKETIELLMPQVKPQEPDTYLCTALKVEDDHKYITGFIPKADASIAHHVLLYGCDQPGGELGTVWNCGEMTTKSTKQYQAGSVCASGAGIIYAWAMEAPRLTLPPDVGFDVGQGTPIKYLVLQVHYKNVTKFLPPQNGDDSSGLQLETTSLPTKKQAGVYLMVTGGYIPAHRIEYFEAACTFDEDKEFYPFAYRTHAHTLGRVISGYRVRDGVWTEIGRADPRKPEMFYNVTTPGIAVKKGDILAARCTMENNLDHDVSIGATQNDEMCNFYIMYYVERPPILQTHTCATPGPPSWYWRDFEDLEALKLDAAPANASVIPGTDEPLVRNAVDVDEYRRGEMVDGMPGRFEDIAADQIVDQAIQNLDSDDLLYLVQRLAAEEEAEEAARERIYQYQQMMLQRQQRMMGAYPQQVPVYEQALQ